MATSADAFDFTRVFLMRGLEVVEREIRELFMTLRADGRPAQAQLVWEAYQAYLAELRRIARKIAVDAQAAIQDAEAGSRVRGHGGQGAALGDFIGKSEPLLDLDGSVGINDTRYLENSGVGWWWTNEFGFSGHEGREIQGLFFPSATPPMSNPFSLDPTFRPGRGGKGVIENPIPAREFVLEGSNKVSGEWHAQIQQADARLIADIHRVMQKGRLRAGARRSGAP